MDRYLIKTKKTKISPGSEGSEEPQSKKKKSDGGKDTEVPSSPSTSRQAEDPPVVENQNVFILCVQKVLQLSVQK